MSSKPKVYLETTIPSYLVSRPSRNLITAGHQQITRDWWDKRRASFDLFISQFVIDEIKAGDSRAALARMEAMRGISKLRIPPEMQVLAADIMRSSLIPQKAAADAVHIAVSAVNSMDFLLTWNCAHIANATIAAPLRAICARHGLSCPVICTPEELMG